VALAGDTIVGHVSYRIHDLRCEITSIDTCLQQAGIGTRLLQAAIEAARRVGCQAVWLTTTNDNIDALRFYQRRGFRLSALHPGAVDRARDTLKPELPAQGSYGIPMRDELDLELAL
jgi:ribosomal protein S18 acetylase RimI-like enzyme